MRDRVTSAANDTKGRDHAPWSRSSQAVLTSLGVDPRYGLSREEAGRRARAWGLNQLAPARPRKAIFILLAQFRSIVVALLLIAGLLAFVFSEILEGLAILAVVLINATIGFLTEWRAIRSMEALRQFARTECVLLREGRVESVPTRVLVPGDIVFFDAGDLVPADLRLFEASKLAVDESTLTGESLPVKKQDVVLDEPTAVLDRENMVFKGTCITRGSGKGVVVATGSRTEFGQIFEQVVAAKPHQTPLEERLNALGAGLAWAVIGIAVVVGAAGIAAGRDLFLAIQVAIALSVAAIPEGLVIVATIALARGMWRLASKHALITRLSAVETLGATSVILTDKTGTLTENRMTAAKVLFEGYTVEIAAMPEGQEAGFRVDGRELAVDEGALLDRLLESGVLCNNASLQQEAGREHTGVGDPTELALLVAAAARNIWQADLCQQAPEISEDPFDPDSKRMATVHRSAQGFRIAAKGAPEAIIPRCTAVRACGETVAMGPAEREQWLRKADQLGDEALRTIAIAERVTPAESEDPYEELVLLGIVGLEDPARPGVDRAIRLCHKAGIRVVMVTGDHAATARNIAVQTGITEASAEPRRFLGGTEVDRLFADGDHDRLLDARVFSRVTPEQKLKLIDLYQKNGDIVAMTGDGVNDAPALKKADIGVAMGVRGTAVAKEAAVMVLQDDEFSTIVSAVAQGRAIFSNIRKFVIYLLSCNASEVLVVSLATVSGAPLPLLPLQILFLNLVTDVFPALALGVGEGSRVSMERPPRPAKERILTRTHWLHIALFGLVMSMTVLAAMATSIFVLDFDIRKAVTVAFCTLALAQMWHVLNMREEMRALVNNEITRNRWVWGALLLCLLLVLAAVYVPLLAEVLELSAPGTAGWALIVVSSFVPLVLAPIVRGSRLRQKKAH